MADANTKKAAAGKPASKAKAGATSSGSLNRYSVEIPRCLLGAREIAAESPEAAVATYKAAAGVTQHSRPAVVKKLA